MIEIVNERIIIEEVKPQFCPGFHYLGCFTGVKIRIRLFK